MKKRIISLGLVVALLVGMCTNLAGCGAKETTVDTQIDTDSNYLTKAEWMSGLAKIAGLTESSTTQPYFTDIKQTDELFPYVQAAGDWKLFEQTGGEFEPDAEVTREFAIATAVIASDVLEKAGYVEEDAEAIDYATCIQFAYDNGNIEQMDEAFLAEPVSEEEGQAILEWLEGIYSNPIVQPKEEIVLQEGVVDFRETTAEIIVAENTVTISGDAGQNLQVGDVFLIPPTEEVPCAAAKKVVSVTTDAAGNMIVVTEEPELGEVFSEINIEQAVAPDMAYIKLNDGVTLSEENTVSALSNSYQLLGGGGHLGATKKKYEKDKDNILKSISNEKIDAKEVHLTIAASTKDGVSIKDEALSETVNIAVDDTVLESEEKIDVMLHNIFDSKIKKRAEDLLKGMGYIVNGGDLMEMSIKKREKFKEKKLEIKGTLDMTDIYAIVNLKVKDGDIKKFNVTFNYDAKIDLKLAGNLRKEIYLGDLYFPIANVAMLKGSLYIYLDGNGEVHFKVVTGSTTELTYRDNTARDFRKRTKDRSQPWDTAVKMDGQAGVGTNVSLSIVNLDVLNFGVDVGGQLKYTVGTSIEPKESIENDIKTVTNQKFLNVDGTVAFPVITVYAGFDLILIDAETKVQLYGPEGTQVKVKPITILDESCLLAETYKYYDKDGKELYAPSEAFESVFEEFVEAPVNARITYDNFYSIDGLREFINRNVFYDKSRMDEAQQYIIGTDMYYSEDDRYYADGHMEKGAELSLRTQEEERFDSDYSLMYYNESELTMLRTDRAHVDKRAKTDVGNVGGFSDFLIDYGCATVPDMVEALGLSSEFKEKAAISEIERVYEEQVSTQKYGMVTIKLECIEGYVDLKALTFVFEDGSASPYKKIFVYQQLANTLTADIPILRVEAYTPAYYEGE